MIVYNARLAARILNRVLTSGMFIYHKVLRWSCVDEASTLSLSCGLGVAY